MVIFGPKPWVKPFGIMSIFRLFEYHVFIAQRSVFSFQNIVKDFFLAYIAYKKESRKTGHFWTKTMGYPVWKNVNFSTYCTSCFLSLERCFFAVEYLKRHFPGLYWKKKKLPKWPFLDQKHGLSPLVKCQFIEILNLFFFQPTQALFRSRIW